MSVLNKDGNVTYPKLRDVNNCIEGNLYFKYYVRKKKEINQQAKLPTSETRNKEQTKLNPHRRKEVITGGEIDDTVEIRGIMSLNNL